MDALTITESSLLHDVDRLRMLSHNLANATTPGYRRDVAVARGFDTQLSAELDDAQVRCDTPLGTRRILYMKGRSFSGPRLRGPDPPGRRRLGPAAARRRRAARHPAHAARRR